MDSTSRIPSPAVVSDHHTRPAQHLGYLDGLRALAALYVVIHHAMLEVWSQSNGLHKWELLAAAPFRYGHFAVGLFIALSGFCLMLPVVRGDGTLRGGTWRFFGRRARRILPPFYAALLVSLILIALLIGRRTGTHWDICLPVTFWSVLVNILMLQDIWPFSRNVPFFGMSGSVNHVFWSVAVEWKIYFLFPVLVLVWRRLGPGLTTLAAGLFAVALFSVAQGRTWEGLSPQFLVLFVLGMLAATITQGKLLPKSWEWRRFPWAVAAVGLALLLAVVNYHWRRVHSGWPVFTQDILAGVAAFALLLAASQERGWLQRLLSRRPLVWVGTFSYSVYLLHAPLLQVIWQYLLYPLHLGSIATFSLLVCLGTPLIVGLCYLFFLACERPFLNTRPHETPAETARDAALSPAP